MKTPCISCGDFSLKPLSERGWCQDCENEANISTYTDSEIDEILRGMRG